MRRREFIAAARIRRGNVFSQRIGLSDRSRQRGRGRLLGAKRKWTEGKSAESLIWREVARDQTAEHHRANDRR
jgi:hypothetical protein